MIRHIFFDKCNTIIKGSDLNTGLNPVAELNVGNTLTRILLHFNLNELKASVSDGNINVDNLKHIIRMTNCGGINLSDNDIIMSECSFKKRASSFEIIAFKLPCEWDGGRGFDFNGDYVKESKKSLSKDGSTWYQSKNGVEWDENGVYSNTTLNEEYIKYKNNEKSLIIGSMAFDYGTENMAIDVTTYINDVLMGNNSYYGIGIAFAPKYEIETKENRFISFFTNHTNTFFLPYLETINSQVITDNRYDFHIGMNNNLYLYVSIDGKYVNLDNIPTCTINNKSYEVSQCGKGIYCVNVIFNRNEVEAETILYDTWSNLVLNGMPMDDVEMEFVVKPMENKVTIGKRNANEQHLEPQITNINDKESIKIGEIREVIVDFIEEYSYGKKGIPSFAEYKIYVKEGDREIEVFPYQQLNRYLDEHSFILNTNDLIPNKYYVDIRTKQGRTSVCYEKVVEFEIVNNVTNFRI